MKPVQIQQEFENTLMNFLKKCLYVSATLIIILMITAIFLLMFDFVCFYDNYYKINGITSDQSKKEKRNNIKNINDINICFNSSDSKSYESIIEQLNELFEKNYCYDTNDIKNFELNCQEYLSYNFSRTFNIKSNQIIQFQNYCLKNNTEYGYKNSSPCIVFIYLKKNKNKKLMFYKFPITIYVKNNYKKQIACNLFYNKNTNKTLLEKYNLHIVNGQC